LDNLCSWVALLDGIYHTFSQIFGIGFHPFILSHGSTFPLFAVNHLPSSIVFSWFLSLDTSIDVFISTALMKW